jgi:hypothetical protein
MAGLFFCFFLFFFQSGICFRCRLDNYRRFPNFQLPTIGVTADFYILHFLDNRTINFVQRKHNFCCLMPKYFEGPMTSDFLQDPVCVCKGKSICSKNCVCVEQNLSCGCQGNDTKYVLSKCCFRWRKFDKGGTF